MLAFLSLVALADSYISKLIFLHINLSQTENVCILFVLFFKLDWCLFSSFLSSQIGSALKISKFPNSEITFRNTVDQIKQARWKEGVVELFK